MELLLPFLNGVRHQLQVIDVIAAPTVYRFAPLEDVAGNLSGMTGMDIVSIKFTLALFLAFPHAAANRFLPTATLRHVWAIVGGVLLCQFVFGPRWVHPFAIATLCYSILTLTRGIRALDQWRHVIAAGACFAYLTLRHLTRSGVTATNVDDSVLQMVLTVKLYSLAYNIYDGTVDAAHLAATIKDPSTSAGAKKVAEDRVSRSIPAPPSLLEFYGYVFNPSTFFVGPAFEITEYLAAQRRSGAPEGTTGAKRILAALLKLGFGVVFLVILIAAGPYLSMDAVFAQATSASPPPVWYRIVYAHLVMELVRVQYYGVWMLGEGAAVLAGFGFRPESRDWAGAANVHPWEVETLTSLGDVLRHWNIYTQSWLERYVFKRAPRQYNRWLTFGASAFWHGFYPGYYLAFFTVPLLQEASKSTFALLRPIVTGGTGKYDTSRIEYKVYLLFKWVVRTLVLDYTLCPFLLLDAARGIALWRSAYFCVHIAAIVIVVIGMLFAPKHHGHHHRGAAAKAKAA